MTGGLDTVTVAVLIAVLTHVTEEQWEKKKKKEKKGLMSSHPYFHSKQVIN